MEFIQWLVATWQALSALFLKSKWQDFEARKSGSSLE